MFLLYSKKLLEKKEYIKEIGILIKRFVFNIKSEYYFKKCELEGEGEILQKIEDLILLNPELIQDLII